MVEKHQLTIADNDPGCLFRIGILIMIFASMIFYSELKSEGLRSDNLVQAMFLFLAGMLALLLRIFHVIDRLALTINTYWGLKIPSKKPRLLIRLNRRSLKDLKNVPIRREKVTDFAPKMGPISSQYKYRVELEIGSDIIYITSCKSRNEALGKAKEIEEFLQDRLPDLHNNDDERGIGAAS